MHRIEILVPEKLHTKSIRLVQRFAEAIASKLFKAQQKYGYTDNWARKDWMVECQRGLLNHVDKGDPRDVAIYAAFAWHHKWPTAFPQGWSLGYTPGFKPGTYQIGCEDDCAPD